MRRVESKPGRRRSETPGEDIERCFSPRIRSRRQEHVMPETSKDGRGHCFVATGYGAEGFLTDADVGDQKRVPRARSVISVPLIKS